MHVDSVLKVGSDVHLSAISIFDYAVKLFNVIKTRDNTATNDDEKNVQLSIPSPKVNDILVSEKIF